MFVSLLRRLDRAPDALRRHRHLDVGDTELGERIDHGVDHGAERPGRAAFAGAAHAEPVGRGQTSLMSVVNDGRTSARGMA